MTPGTFDYIRDPQAIYARSFELVRAATDLSRVPDSLHDVAIRLVHACGMPDVVEDLDWRGDPAGAASAALRKGAPVLCDARMVLEGIIRSRLPVDNGVHCTLNDEGVEQRAKASRTTRSAAAVDLWLPRLAGAVVVIGNAPTALFRLLELLGEGAPRPAVILGFPVGFVGAAESKDALLAESFSVPVLALRGRRGGSALAAAAVNAMATIP